MLAEQVDGVIGVDTHRDTLAAAAVSPIGAVLETTDAPAHGRGYQRLLDFALSHVPDRRCWALEGTGSFGAGLAAFLEDAGERVVEVCRPKRPPVRGGRKTDMLDAIRAAREALAAEHVIQPRMRGAREAMRVLLATRQGAVHASTAAINQLKAMIISAPDDLRAELRRLNRPAQITRCASLHDRPALSIEHRMTIRALRSTAQRVRHLQVEARDLENEILQIVRQQAPELLALLGVGPITAAQILVSWSHPGRFRSEAAFASFAGVAPIPASSGLTNKHRLNRGGDRQLNRAMHTITLIRMRLDPTTKAYVARRISEGKSSRDAQRCLKRNVCRQIFKILERRSQNEDELSQAA
ncbi:IS110 family transposase [Streptomyces scabiei]|nr:IS110 family transposase [Streptomyces scabiei]MDX2574728.1 IS110 family transposase [Streptomyces scabiei]MDX2651658.1 IS110 family transposase [Streptomyces scabiei]MDX2722810.1 IS110 family transposase [Streptomyces scabiei]MDX2866064.1 IS110 family transposase [Streptomyces scabiei]MDX2884771.1 IS110 family transposase [Streptomyces scabiei]